MKKLSLLIVLIILVLFAVAPMVHAWPHLTTAEREFDRKLSDFGGILGFSRNINPQIAEEKSRFFEALAAGYDYQPQFTYKKLSQKVHEAARSLETCEVPEGAWSELLGRVRQELLLKYQILCLRGQNTFTKEASRLYPLPDVTLKMVAHQILRDKNITSQESTKITPVQMQEQLKKALTQFGLTGWQVVLSQGMSARASVSSGARKVKVNQNATFFQHDVGRLVHHELEVHAVRAERGRRMPLRIFQTGLADYLSTEEGLAAWTESTWGIKTGLRLFALRVLAVDWAARDSFSMVFRRLCAMGASKSDAWAITVRAKRGLRDTGQAGCWPKDAVYLRGYVQVKSWMKSGKRVNDLKRFGKIGLQDFATIQRLRKMQ